MEVLRDEDDEAVLEAAAWTLGQLGRHSAKHVEEIAGQHVLTTLAEVRSVTGLPLWFQCAFQYTNRVAS